MLAMGMSLSSCSSDDENLYDVVPGTANTNKTALSKGAWDFYAVSEGDTIYFKKDTVNVGECYVVAKQYDVINPETGEVVSVYSADDLNALVAEYSSKYSDFKYKYTTFSFYSGDITIPESVTVNGSTYIVTGIGDYAFARTEITSLKLAPTIRYISNDAIKQCDYLQNVDLSENLTEIGEYAFTADSLLTEITLPSKLKKLGLAAFGYCLGIQKINIPASLTNIEEAALLACENLAYIDVDANNKYYQFKDGMLLNKNGNMLHTYLCTNEASSFTIPESIDSIGIYAFSYCQNLKSVVVKNNITRLPEGIFFLCFNLEQVTLPDNLTHIYEGVFSYCTSLTDVVLPESMECLGEGAFYYTKSLEEINIPAGVTSIGGRVFYGSKSLKTVKSYIASPFAIQKNTFSDYETPTLYVPSGTKETYEATDGWARFKNIEEM